jgi:hypothetical protein
MARFANAELGIEIMHRSSALCWLAGLLEGEGSFLKPIPSDPKRPIISCRMTDRDVVERVATLFGTRVQANEKGQHRIEFAALVKGARAVAVMRLLRPMMSVRRQGAIDQAISTYTAPWRNLTLSEVAAIRRRSAKGESVSRLSRCFEVSRPTIRSVLDGGYRVRPEIPWGRVSRAIRGATPADTGLSLRELYWLAGWLEGEGSFCSPPPSSPLQPRVHGGSSDKDVIDEAARLLQVSPSLGRRRAPNRLPYWRVLLRGARAVALMQSIRPVMGARRVAQIDAATLSPSS